MTNGKLVDLKGKSGQTVVLTFPYNENDINAVKGIDGRRFDHAKKRWEILLNTSNVNDFIEMAMDCKFDFTDSALNVVENVVQDLENIKEANNPTEEFKVPETIKANLRPYQVEGSAYMARFKRAMNGSEPGLGKTLMTITAIESLQAYPALMVVPASLKDNWAEEYGKFLPTKKVQVINSKDEIYSGDDVYVINYDIIAKKLDRLKKMKFNSVSCDESHKLKNSKAQRSKAVKSISKNIPVRYLLSGTAITNRPDEFVNQIDILGRLNDFGGFMSFVFKYCGAYKGRWGLDTSGATNLEELYKEANRLFYFRRNKSEVLTELPEKQQTDIGVELSNFGEYKKAEYELLDYLQNKILQDEDIKKAIKGLDKEEAKRVRLKIISEIENRVEQAEQLVALTTLRKLAGLGKVQYAIDWVKDFIESGKKILVFAHHKEVISSLVEAFKCPYIDGTVPVEKRQGIVNKFQKDEDIKIMVLNIQAGGVGLTLTAASNVLFVEEPWTPAEKDQAEDRAHRIGQKNAVNIYNLLGKGTIDYEIHDMLAEKRKITDAINAGIFTAEKNFSIQTELFNNLLRKNED